MSSERESFISKPTSQESREMVMGMYYALARQESVRTEREITDVLIEDFQKAHMLFLKARSEHAEKTTHYTHQTEWGSLELYADRAVAISPLATEQIILGKVSTLTLEELMRSPDRVVSSTRIGKLGFGEIEAEEVTDINQLGRVRISVLRKHLGHTNKTPLIYTIPRFGYSLTPQQ